MNESIDWDALKEAARSVRKHAYAPYSNYHVGAAILAGQRIFTGCNVENASYPVGLCAERAALSAAVAAGCQKIEAVVIVTYTPATPCGMCRQALVEFNPDVPIMMVSDQKETQTTLTRLMPDPFDLS